MRSNTKRDGNYTGSYSLWQALEYRKRLKRLIEQGFSINELDKQSRLLFKECKDEQCR